MLEWNPFIENRQVRMNNQNFDIHKIDPGSHFNRDI